MSVVVSEKETKRWIKIIIKQKINEILCKRLFIHKFRLHKNKNCLVAVIVLSDFKLF